MAHGALLDFGSCSSTSGDFAALWAHDFTEASAMGSVVEVGVDTLTPTTWHVDVGMDVSDAEKKEWMKSLLNMDAGAQAKARGWGANKAVCSQLT